MAITRRGVFVSGSAIPRFMTLTGRTTIASIDRTVIWS
jgi:hypothetical protein